MLKVLHLINYTGGGGTEKYIYSLGEQIHNKDAVFYIVYSEEGTSLMDFKNLGIETFKLNMNGPFDFKAAKNLAKICKENSIDVVHTHFLRENYIAILSKLFGSKVKVINTRHMIIENNFKVRSMNKIMTIFNKNIIAVSSAVEKLLKSEVINKRKIKLIYTGIDLTSIDTKSSIRDEFNLNDEVLITSVARFSEEKGHDFLIDSIDELNKNTDASNYKFLLIGDGPTLYDSKKLVNKYNLQDKVIFTGYRKDIQNILNGSDIFICHSKEEAFGISILEGLSAKLPVITTDTGGTREIINKDNGFLIPYGDIEEFSSAIYRLIEDDSLRDFLGERGYKTLKDNFNINKTIEKTIDIYEN